ncbi:MAG: hypothetical protein ABIU05_11355 [Nitrospirales bacterium]
MRQDRLYITVQAVTLTWEPSRLERDLYTRRGAKPDGLVNGRTRHPKLKEPARLL